MQEKQATILVVDDDPSIGSVVAAILRNADFRVLTANSPAEAIRVAAATEGIIELLLSDVEMPVMSGPDLGQIIKQSRPEIHVMFMSGGNTGNLLVLNYGWAYIAKPFLPMKLVQMVRDVLSSEDRSQLGGHEFDSRKDHPPYKQ